MTTQSVSAAKTLFLPLVVKSFGGTERYRTLIDANITRGIAGTDIVFPDRSRAAALADYSGSWPPGVAELQQIAAATGADNVIVGTVTAVGREFSLDVKYFDLLAPTNPVFFYQTAANEADLPRAVSELVRSIQQYNDRRFTIASIAPEGNNRIDSGAILRKISTRRGFRVKEKPVITSVTFTGVEELAEDDIRGAANVREHLILNPEKLAAAREAVLELYRSRGFYNSTVKTVVNTGSDGAAVVFEINEGQKIFIKEIKVEGNTAFSDSKILGQVETGERWFMSWLTDSGLLDQTKIQQDTKRIVAFYADNGYLDARVGNPEVRQDGKWLYITFNVEEGPRYRVGTVGIIGSDLGDNRPLLKLLSVRDEKYVSRKAVRADILKLTDYFAEQGYAFASIKPQFTRADGDRMDINFNIDKGRLVYIDRILIRGNTRTHDNVIRRELSIAEGGVFNAKALRDSSRALQRLQYFEEVNITPEPGMDPDRMTIMIDVKERYTGSLSIGAGYSSADKLLFMGQISQNNFLGRGDTLSLSATLGGSSARFNLGYTNPHLNDSDLSWGFDAFHTRREYDDYTRESTGGGLRIGYPLWEKWRVYSNYSLTNTDLSDVSEDASYVIRNSVDIQRDIGVVPAAVGQNRLPRQRRRRQGL